MCFQEVSVAWAKEIIDNCLDTDWRGHVDNKCFMAWKVGSVERLDYEWVMLFPRDESAYKNWRGYSKVRLGFLGWSTAASILGHRPGTQGRCTGRSDSFSHRAPPNLRIASGGGGRFDFGERRR